MDFLPEGMSAEDVAHMLELMPALAIPGSRLLRVVSVGQSVETQGVTVDLIAIEIREAGAILHWRANASREAPMVTAEAWASDDQGTTYQMSPAQSGSSGRQWQGETFMIPAPPADANLEIVLESFGPPGGMPPMTGYIAMEPVRGPWRFLVSGSTG